MHGGMMDRIHTLRFFKIGGLAACMLHLVTGCATVPPAERLVDQSTQATIWMQQAGEYQALCYQAFNLGKQAVDAARAAQSSASAPWAVMVDLDETMVDNSPYAAWQLLEHVAYEEDTWEAWVRSETTEALPGALDFARYVVAQGGKLFYVSNRLDQSFAATQANLQALGFPEVTEETLLLKSGSSNKQARLERIQQAGYQVVLMMGDNLNDFPELGTYHQANAVRNASVAQSHADFGHRFILLPNPSYGDWEAGMAKDYFSLSAAEKLALREQVLKAWPGVNN
jgi:5'-nucleotidase (lipoprotein e(P4) family)